MKVACIKLVKNYGTAYMERVFSINLGEDEIKRLAIKRIS